MRLLYCKSELSALIYFSLRYLTMIGLEPSKGTQESRYRVSGHVSDSRAQRHWEKNRVFPGYDHGKGSGKGSDKGAGKKGYEKGGGKGRKYGLAVLVFAATSHDTRNLKN